MKILKSLALLAGFAFIAGNISAQEKCTKDQQQMAKKETDKVKKNVTGVNSDQESKILAVEQEHAKACDEAKIATKGDKDAMKSKMKEACESRDEKIKGILNADQYTQYQKMEKEETDKKTAK